MQTQWVRNFLSNTLWFVQARGPCQASKYSRLQKHCVNHLRLWRDIYIYMSLVRRDVLIQFGAIRWVARVDRDTTLRTILQEACLPVYNSVAKVVNCHGLGTCGTCAVAVSSAEPSPLTEASWRETARLSLPPHSAANTAAHHLRLACQCRFASNPSGSSSAQLAFNKLDGIWGHRSPTKDIHCKAEEVLGWEANLDMCAIRGVKQFFPAWLWQEMRSNHAGETGAVCIYLGCLDALALRRRLGPLTSGWRDYEDKLQAFAEEHERSERMHLVIFHTCIILPPNRYTHFLLPIKHP